jgi:CO/xanthine dehydrogenase Mo-binding subunit
VDGIEDDRGVGGSRTTRLVGKLLIQLSKQLLRKLSDLVAAEFGDSPESIRYAEGRFIVPPGRAVTFLEAAALATEPIVESHLFRPTARDRSSVAIALAAEVCSDAETGAVTPRRLITVQEVGRVIDPLLFKRQIEGGVLQGLGYALMENLVLQDGRVQNANLHEYKIPTQSDIPSIEVILVGKDPSLGITPVGEGASAGVAPAIINALIDLTGVRQFDIPITPEAVFAKSPIRAEAGPVDRG